PEIWANTCCSHPRRGEAIEEAAHRRLQQELGLDCELTYVYKFEYHARYGELGSEHELCSVFVGTTDAKPVANPTEVAAWRYVSPEQLDRELVESGESFSPWLKLEWERLRGEFKDALPTGSTARPTEQTD
ncbi:MAG: NUDIX domain-containing protein, partial [Dermatophilaceae bacterium]